MFFAIDGNALAYSCFFRSSPKEIMNLKTEEERQFYYEYLKKSPDGEYIGMIELFINTVLDFIGDRFLNINEVAVCFDQSRLSTFRKELFPEYKAQRSQKPVPLAFQIEMLKRILKDAGIKVYEHPKYEADDIVGSIANYFKQMTDVRILTKDKDYLQLIDDKVHVFMLRDRDDVNRLSSLYGDNLCIRGTVFEYTTDVVKGEYDITPNQITAWKAVSGDSSDNIPGVKGVSDKTIIPLLQNYDSLLSIYQELQAYNREGKLDILANRWKTDFGIKPSNVKKMWEGRKDAAFFQKLVTIKRDIPVKASLEDFKIRNINLNILQNHMERLGLNETSEEIERLFLFSRTEREELE